MRAPDAPAGRWLFVAAQSSAIGAGHAARLHLLATTARRLGVDAELAVLAYPPSDSGEAAAALAARRSVDEGDADPAVLVVDGPDAFIDGVATGWPEGTLKVAFRMYGIERDALPAEDVTISPSFEPTYAREVRRPRPHLLLGGTATILVRPTCFARADDRTSEPASLLVSMGGADPAGLTEIACRALLEVSPRPPVTVVVGALNVARDQLHASFGHQFEVLDQGDLDFDRRLRHASIAVINGGLTRYECVAAATPFVAISLDPDQARLTERVVARGVGRHVGLVDPGIGDRIRDEVAALLADPRRRTEMAARAANLLLPDAASDLVRRVDERRLERFPTGATGEHEPPPDGATHVGR